MLLLLSLINYTQTMREIKYIDIHSHRTNQQDDCIQVSVLSPNEKSNKSYFCMGIHPWSIVPKNFKILLESIALQIDNPYFFAIGETGLDRIKGAPFELQIKSFKMHLKLAKKHNINLVIIHCVKAYSDIMSILKSSAYKGLVLFHDYNGSVELTDQLLKNDRFYFSFGQNLFRENSRGAKSFLRIPCDRFFLETDDSQLSISEVYTKAEKLKNKPLKDELLKNFYSLIDRISSVSKLSSR